MRTVRSRFCRDARLHGKPVHAGPRWPKIGLAGKTIFDALASIGIFLLAKEVFARARTAKVNAPGSA